MNKILLRQDSRDLHVLQHFGGPLVIPDNFELDKGLTNPVESPYDITCTAISGTDVCTNQTGIKYDIDDLWALTPHTAEGADPRDSMSIICHRGLQPLDGGPRDIRWEKYFRADGNSGDYFHTTQISMLSVNSPTTVATNWYEEWNNIGPDGVLPSGKTRISGHDYEMTGWRLTSTGVQAHIKHWRGYMVWMPKEVFNMELHKYGTGCYIPTTSDALIQSEKSLSDWIKDMLVNIGLSLRDYFNHDVSSVYPPFPPKIVTWAKAIAQWEGAKASLNNPGNLKVTPLTRSWGIQPAMNATDGGNIGRFVTYQQGFTALCNLLVLACKNELLAYHHTRTFHDFTEIYAGHPPQGYINGVAKMIPCALTDDISSFLT